MKLLYNLDDKNYSTDGIKCFRVAVRGIIMIDDKIVLIKNKRNEYKLPGGGQENDESFTDTLIREVKEETGLDVISSSIKEYGLVKEKRKSTHNNEETFFQDSYYYTCEVTYNLDIFHLHNYEIEAGHKLAFVNAKEAYDNNINLVDAKWVRRDTLILKELMEK